MKSVLFRMKSEVLYLLFVVFLQVILLLLVLILINIFPKLKEPFSQTNLTNIENTVWMNPDTLDNISNMENFIQNACTIKDSDKKKLNEYMKKLSKSLKTLSKNCDSSGNCPNKKSDLDNIQKIIWDETDSINAFINKSTTITPSDQFFLEMYIAKFSDGLNILYNSCDSSGNC